MGTSKSASLPHQLKPALIHLSFPALQTANKATPPQQNHRTIGVGRDLEIIQSNAPAKAGPCRAGHTGTSPERHTTPWDKPTSPHHQAWSAAPSAFQSRSCPDALSPIAASPLLHTLVLSPFSGAHQTLAFPSSRSPAPRAHISW